jgi:hypothetical protein
MPTDPCLKHDAEGEKERGREREKVRDQLGEKEREIERERERESTRSGNKKREFDQYQGQSCLGATINFDDIF